MHAGERLRRFRPGSGAPASPNSVAVPVMHVRQVGVIVQERRVRVRMGVWLGDLVSVLVAVVVVVDVRVLVFQRLVHVLVTGSQEDAAPGRRRRERAVHSTALREFP